MFVVDGGGGGGDGVIVVIVCLFVCLFVRLFARGVVFCGSWSVFVVPRPRHSIRSQLISEWK